jgi:hypothetical protein
LGNKGNGVFLLNRLLQTRLMAPANGIYLFERVNYL